MRSVIVAANWKMHKTVTETKDFIDRLKKQEHELPAAQIVICAPYIALQALSERVDSLQVALGAQNMHWDKEGAYTGEISPLMLRELGIHYVIIGHSERRHIFMEKGEMINRKVLSAFAHGLVPILCIGETETERRDRRTEEVLLCQLQGALKDISKKDANNLIVAYEPVWAIGSGNPASGEDAVTAARFVRNVIADLYDVETAECVRVQYGGSVKAGNVAEFMRFPDIDGALVGGASLEVDAFVSLLQAGVAAKETTN